MVKIGHRCPPKSSSIDFMRVRNSFILSARARTALECDSVRLAISFDIQGAIIATSRSDETGIFREA